MSENVFKDFYFKHSMWLKLSELLIVPRGIVCQYVDIYGCVSIFVLNHLLWDL